jgi:Zn finger protein HypA/HybF involved in hydrogenase expression
MEQITQFIEEEIDRRVNERISGILSKISQTYDISMKQLLRDIETSVSGTTCHGLTKSGKKCPRGVKDGSGYCKSHKDQKPQQLVKPTSMCLSMKAVHTHTLPPMFLAGCPACEKIKRVEI